MGDGVGANEREGRDEGSRIASDGDGDGWAGVDNMTALGPDGLGAADPRAPTRLRLGEAAIAAPTTSKTNPTVRGDLRPRCCTVSRLLPREELA